MSSFFCTHNSQHEPLKPAASSDEAHSVNPTQGNCEKANASKVNTSKVHNRIRALMEHTTRYAFKGEARLAADSGVSKSALNRLLNGHSSPSFALVSLLTKALEQQLSNGGEPRRLDPRDLVSLDGTYLTPSVCALAGCRGCLPSAAYDEHEKLRPEYKDVKPGQWSLPQPSTQPQSQPQQLPELTPPQKLQAQKLPPLLVPVEIFARGEEASGEESENKVREMP